MQLVTMGTVLQHGFQGGQISFTNDVDIDGVHVVVQRQGEQFRQIVLGRKTYEIIVLIDVFHGKFLLNVVIVGDAFF